MSYHGVGAGPGPVKTYRVDAPFPWGKDTELKLPVQAMIDDAWAAAYPHLMDLEGKLIRDMEDEVRYFAPVMADQLIDEKVRPELERQLEIVFAEIDILKEDALKAAVGIAAGLALAVGLGAWWVKRRG
jgi:hypothetical protein